MDLFARGLLTISQVNFVKDDAGISIDVEPILSTNQYLHLAEWLFVKKQLSQEQLDKIKAKFILIPYSGI